MNLGSLPLFDRLVNRRSILLAGAGGGFDVFAGLPIYRALRKQGSTVHLANLSFTRLDASNGRRPAPSLVEIGPDTSGPDGYFPERHLARFLRDQGEAPPRVFAFEKTGVVPLRAAYETLVEELAVDALVVVDGGSDSLLCGDEVGLGTPGEDMATVASTHNLAVDEKMLLSIGFGVDTYHGVSHAQVLESVAAITQAGGFLGAFSLLRETEEFAFYKAAVDAAHAAMPEQASIVNASIVSAVEGDFGDVHRTKRTRGSTLWINPLMAMYFAFELEAVAKRVAYLPLLEPTQTFFEVGAVIDGYQRTVRKLRPRVPIPI